MPSLIGKALRARNATPVPMGSGTIAYLPGTAAGANVDLTLIKAFKSNGTTFANVSLLASAAAGPTWKLFRTAPMDGRRRYSTHDQGSDQRTEVVQHAALNCLNNPAVIQSAGVKIPAWTRFSLFEISGIWMEVTGKSYWVVDRGGNDASIPLGLWPVRPDRIVPVPDKNNYLAGYIYTSPDGKEKIPLRPIDVIFNRYPDPEDPYGGVGPIHSVLTDIEAARYASEWNRNYFINSAEPGGIIQVDHELDDEEFNQLVDRWRDTHRGVARSHRIAVLEAGATWVPNGHSIKDMDFGGLRTIMADTIREALGMHKVMTGVTDDVNRANAQTGEEVFASWKVAPRLDRWRDVLNSQLLPLFSSSGTGVEFDYIYPTPLNREQDALELTAKSNAALTLVTAGYDQSDVLTVVGLPDMAVALNLTSEPALPPRWTLGLPPPAPAPAAAKPAVKTAAGDEEDDESKPTPENVLRRQMAAWNRLAGVK
jgi:phage portal protein BeeE